MLSPSRDEAIPWLPCAVDLCCRSGIQNGIWDGADLTVYVLQWVYPMEHPSAWPYTGDDPELRRVQARVTLRANRLLATAADDAAEGNQQ